MDNKKMSKSLNDTQIKEKVKALLIEDRYKLIMLQPFIGRLATFLNLVPILDSRIDIACTDGTSIYVNAKYYLTLSEDERLGIIAHEVWHCALRHFARRGNRDRKKFNYATDIEVDLLLTSAGFKIDILPFDPDWAGRSAEEIYELMYPRMEQFQKQDTHLYPEDASLIKELSSQNDSKDDSSNSNKKDKNNDNKEDGDDENTNNDNDDSSKLSNNPKSKAKNKQKNSSNLPIEDKEDSQENNTNDDNEQYDSDFNFNFSDDWEENWQDNLQSVLDLGLSPLGINGICGILPGNLSNLVNKKSKTPPANWKQILLNYVTNTFGGPIRFLPPNRRFAWKKLYLPSRERKQEINIVLALDTSGSMYAEVPQFITELEAMTSAFGEYKITIIQCDCEIKDVQTYTSSNPIPMDKLKFHGFGGTDLRPPFNYVKEKFQEVPTVFIYITDGEGPAPKNQPNYPVLWAITPDGTMPCKWGTKVKINQK